MLADDDLEWYHLALCQHMNDPVEGKEPHTYTDKFVEGYEDDPVLAQTMDGICLACPVRNMCLRAGIEGKEYGLWGAVFLNNGKVDEQRNAHKTEDIWNEIRSGLGG
jgi:hypothetical protein